MMRTPLSIWKNLMSRRRSFFVGGGEAPAYSAKIIALFGSSLIGYWPLNELSGPVAFDISGNGRNGTHNAVTLGQPGIGDGGTSTKYDGSTSWTNGYTASLAGAFNGQELTVLIWYKVRAASVWTDGISRSSWVILADGNNFIQLQKPAAVNTVILAETAAAVQKSVSIATSYVNWKQIALTVSKSNDRLKAYLN